MTDPIDQPNPICRCGESRWRSRQDGTAYCVKCQGERPPPLTYDELAKLADMAASIEPSAFLARAPRLSAEQEKRLLAMLEKKRLEYAERAEQARDPFDAEGYRTICGEWALGSTIDLWVAVGEALSNRPGWHLELRNPSPPPPFSWCFGPGGSAHLVISASAAGFVLYMADTDTSRTVATLPELTDWLDANESSEGER